jgi:hypothetical protein
MSRSVVPSAIFSEGNPVEGQEELTLAVIRAYELAYKERLTEGWLLRRPKEKVVMQLSKLFLRFEIFPFGTSFLLSDPLSEGREQLSIFELDRNRLSVLSSLLDSRITTLASESLYLAQLWDIFQALQQASVEQIRLPFIHAQSPLVREISSIMKLARATEETLPVIPAQIPELGNPQALVTRIEKFMETSQAVEDTLRSADAELRRKSESAKEAVQSSYSLVAGGSLKLGFEHPALATGYQYGDLKDSVAGLKTLVSAELMKEIQPILDRISQELTDSEMKAEQESQTQLRAEEQQYKTQENILRSQSEIGFAQISRQRDAERRRLDALIQKQKQYIQIYNREVSRHKAAMSGQPPDYAAASAAESGMAKAKLEIDLVNPQIDEFKATVAGLEDDIEHSKRDYTERLKELDQQKRDTSERIKENARDQKKMLEDRANSSRERERFHIADVQQDLDSILGKASRAEVASQFRAEKVQFQIEPETHWGGDQNLVSVRVAAIQGFTDKCSEAIHNLLDIIAMSREKIKESLAGDLSFPTNHTEVLVPLWYIQLGDAGGGASGLTITPSGLSRDTSARKAQATRNILTPMFPELDRYCSSLGNRKDDLPALAAAYNMLPRVVPDRFTEDGPLVTEDRISKELAKAMVKDFRDRLGLQVPAKKKRWWF